MEKYYKDFIGAQKRIQLREKASQDALKLIEDKDEKLTLEKGIAAYNTAFYASRCLPIFVVGGLLATPFLKRTTWFYVREISFILLISGSILFIDYANSEMFWKRNSETILKYTSYNDMGLSQAQMEKMKQLYEKGKNYKPEEQSDKMYDD